MQNMSNFAHQLALRRKKPTVCSEQTIEQTKKNYTNMLVALVTCSISVKTVQFYTYKVN